MRARRPLGLALILGLVTLGPVPASAGGWDSLHFDEDHYVVGEVAVAKNLFFAGELEGAGPLDGRTYHAYLLPRRVTQSGFGTIDAPTIPEGSIRLGALEISGPFVPDGYEGMYGRASLTFTVPEVPTGDYAIGFCDDPCEHDYVGWLAWGWIRIVHTEREGTLLAEIDHKDIEVSRTRYELRKTERALEGARAQLDETRSDLRLERTNAVTPSERIVAVPIASRDRGLFGSVWWLALLAVVATFGGGFALGARRRVRDRVVVPDTVPEDLERLDLAR